MKTINAALNSPLTVLDQVHGENWSAYYGDCLALATQIPDNSIDITVYSPPFSSLYIYSESEADMGNTENDDEFLEQYSFLVKEKLRATRPGRLSCVHIKDMVYYQGSSVDGASGIRPLSDRITEAHLKAGWNLQCRITIWRDPVLERSKTNAHGLLYKTFRGDASFCRVGMPEYLLVFRKWPKTDEEVALQRPVVHHKDDFQLPIWQELASPIWPAAATCWNYGGPIKTEFDASGYLRATSTGGQSGGGDMDLKATDTLNVQQSRDPNAEKHLCLASGSSVLTQSGFKPIELVDVGDSVLTHKGRWRPVIAKINTGVKPTIRLKAKGVPDLWLTPDHEVWGRKVPQGGVPNAVYARKRAKKTVPAWEQAQFMLGSYVNLKLPKIKDTRLYSNDDLWIAGRWLGDGHFGGRDELILSCGHHETKELIKKLGKRLGFVNDTNTAAQIRIKDLGGKIREIIGNVCRGASNKQFPTFAFSLPVDQAKSLLDGYLSADGSFNEARNRISATSISKNLLLGAALLIQRVYGVSASVFPGRPERESVIQGRSVHCKQDWSLSAYLTKEGQRIKPFLLDDGAWKKVSNIDSTEDRETWCLKVAEDESFTAEGCIVHNCPMPLNITNRAIVLWTNPGDVLWTPFGGIGSEGVQALRMGRKVILTELNPTYFRAAVGHLTSAAGEGQQQDIFAAL
ncbi:MAG: hypothetical protein IPH59_12105 [bacterium]|nr:hypothetical protein [bacterium]